MMRCYQQHRNCCLRLFMFVAFDMIAVTNSFSHACLNDTISCEQIRLSALSLDYIDSYLAEVADTSAVRELLLWTEQENNEHLVLNLMHLERSDYPMGNCGNWLKGIAYCHDIPVYCLGATYPIFWDSVGMTQLIIPQDEHSYCQREWDPVGWRLTLHPDNTLCWNRSAKYNHSEPIDELESLAHKYLSGMSYDKYEDRFLTTNPSHSFPVDSLNAQLESAHLSLMVVGVWPYPKNYQLIRTYGVRAGIFTISLSEEGIVNNIVYTPESMYIPKCKIRKISKMLRKMSYTPAMVRSHKVCSKVSLVLYFMSDKRNTI